MTASAREIVDFWLNQVGPAGWYGGGEALDERIRRRYLLTWKAARGGAFDHWRGTPAGALGLLILIDQFPRNMFRGSGLSFATDARARRIARMAIASGHDLATPLEARNFLYLPFAHSEAMADQDFCVHLAHSRMGPPTPDRGLHAEAHRAVIARFGRFPYRNDALGRVSTPEETAWMEEGGYMVEVRRLQAERAGRAA